MSRRISLSSLFGPSSPHCTRPPSYNSLPDAQNPNSSTDSLPLPPPPYLPIRDPSPSQVASSTIPAIPNKPTLYPPKPPSDPRTNFTQSFYPAVVQKRLIALAIVLLGTFLVLAVQIHFLCRTSLGGIGKPVCVQALPWISRWIDGQARRGMHPGVQNVILLGMLVLPFVAYAGVDWWIVGHKKVGGQSGPKVAAAVEFSLVLASHGYYAWMVIRNMVTLVHLVVPRLGLVPDAYVHPVTSVTAVLVGLAVMLVFAAVFRFIWLLHAFHLRLDNTTMYVSLPFATRALQFGVSTELVPVAIDAFVFPTWQVPVYGSGIRTLRFRAATASGAASSEWVLAFDSPGFPGAVDDWTEWCRHVIETRRIERELMLVSGSVGSQGGALGMRPRVDSVVVASPASGSSSSSSSEASREALVSMSASVKIGCSGENDAELVQRSRTPILRSVVVDFS
ncbi:hypothetical protein BCR44DRAFT_302820 [Catenaria anguillulae PL171]|uniref:Uncharacterized protein n=1 Tax=Catenaria anguillulae PL171 TaxID=765915 RepID=A0A1Y2HR68_9FUNG|nr:hypothetical protein BCR44DRAFT_302820 [Catenaria anguillulae PL171]